MIEQNWITRTAPFFTLCIGNLLPDQTLAGGRDFVNRYAGVTAGSAEVSFGDVSIGQVSKGDLVDFKSHLGNRYLVTAGDDGVSWVSINKDNNDTDFTVEVNSSSGDDVVITGDDNKVFVSLYSRVLLNDTLIGVGNYVRFESGRDYTVSGNDKSFWAIVTKVSS